MAAARRTIEYFKGVVDKFSGEIRNFGSAPTMYAGLVDEDGALQLYEGRLRFRSAEGEILADGIEACDYAAWIGEAALADSYLKAPFYRPLGYPEGVYRVGPLARLNAAERCGTPEADAELSEYRQRNGRIVHSAFHYHYARLVETIHALERIHSLLDDSRILDTLVRARAGVNALEGVGMAEAPRGVLVHHYKVDEKGAIQWANLIIATGHNNLAMNRAIEQVSRAYIDGSKLNEGMLNRVSAVVRAYDPCLSCSTHAAGEASVRIQLVSAAGAVVDELKSR
jgi:NAD-reducing hydrogenase large subunit